MEGRKAARGGTVVCLRDNRAAVINFRPRTIIRFSGEGGEAAVVEERKERNDKIPARAIAESLPEEAFPNVAAISNMRNKTQ